MCVGITLARTQPQTGSLANQLHTKPSKPIKYSEGAYAWYIYLASHVQNF